MSVPRRAVTCEARGKRPDWRRRALAGLRLALAILILSGLLTLAGTEQVLARLGDVSLRPVVAAFFFALLGQMLGAFRLLILASSQGFTLRLSSSFQLGVAAVFYGLFLPGGSVTGWAVRFLKLPGGPDRPGAALLVLGGDRALATASGAALGLAAWVVASTGEAPWTALALASVALAAGALGLFSMSSFADRLAGALRTRLARSMAGTADTRLVRPVPAGVLVASGVLSFMVHASGIVAWLLLARAAGLELDALEVAWIRAVAMIAALLPVTAGGVGVRDAAIVHLAALVGVQAADALGFSILVFLSTVLAVGLVGGLGELRWLATRKWR